MWIFLNDSFLSCVENRNDKTTLCVRARFKGDIEAAFPTAKVVSTPMADYAYRAVISKKEAAVAIANRVLGIDYDNFKNSVMDNQRHDEYFRVWNVMAMAQAKKMKPKK